jgi:hypothetical protein
MFLALKTGFDKLYNLIIFQMEDGINCFVNGRHHHFLLLSEHNLNIMLPKDNLIFL